MVKLHAIKGKSIREWAEQDLPLGAFADMVREIDPFFGIYADAGATRKPYKVFLRSYYDDGDEITVEAFNERHAMSIAHDNHGWLLGEMRAYLLNDREAA